MNTKNLFGNGMVIMLFSFIITFFVWVFMPKPHIGYYMEVRDGCNSNQIYPVYRIINNWKYYPDTTAFESSDKDVTLQIFSNLNQK